jgi:hypothetical protein
MPRAAASGIRCIAPIEPDGHGAGESPVALTEKEPLVVHLRPGQAIRTAQLSQASGEITRRASFHQYKCNYR